MTQELNCNNALRPILEQSLFAAALVSREGRIIYCNKVFSDIFREDTGIFGSVSTFEASESYITAESGTYKIYTTPADDSVMAVAVPCMGDNSSLIRDMYAWERHMISAVTIASDNISDLNIPSEGYECLNAIESSVMSLHSKFLITEQLYELRNKSFNDFEEVNISEEVRKFGTELSESLAQYPVGVSLSVTGGIFSRCRFNSVLVLASDFTGRIMDDCCPERISVELAYHDANERILFSVSCEYGSETENKFAGSSDCCTELAELLSEKCDCAVSEAKSGKTATFTADMPKYFSGREFRAPRAEFEEVPVNRFSSMNVLLRSHGINKSYNKRKEN